VGIAKAKELVFSGEMITAEEAFRIGLADVLVDPEGLWGKVEATAKAIIANGPLAVAEAKRVMQQGQSMPLAEACLIEQHSFAGLFSTADQREGMAAFLDKRTAEFKGA
jgi:enoyl-CoA hydratase